MAQAFPGPVRAAVARLPAQAVCAYSPVAMLALSVALQSTVAAERAPSAVSPQSAAAARDQGEPMLDYTVTPLVRVVLASAETAAGRGEKKTGGPLEIGFHREVPAEDAGDFAERLHWFPGDGDTIAGALSVRSPGAAAMRVAIRVRNLGEGEVRFFGGQAGSRFAPVTQARKRRRSGRPS